MEVPTKGIGNLNQLAVLPMQPDCSSSQENNLDDSKCLPTVCFDCPTGYYQTAEGSTFCLPCLTGTYQKDLGSSDCKECPAGYSNGATAVSECTQCKEGRYNEQEEQAACKGCPAGMFSAKKGLNAETKCSPCNAGTYSKAIGATSKDTCIDCQPGKKGTQVGASNEKACSDCGLEEYRGVTDDATTCHSCPTGWTSDRASAKCTVCGAGTAGNGCEPCKEEFARNGTDPDPTQCRRCELGETTIVPGSATCSKCDVGMFGSTAGKCLECPAGYYQDGKGATTVRRFI